MKFKCLFVLLALAVTSVSALQQEYSIVETTNGLAIISFTNKYFNGVSTLEGRLDRSWVPLENFITTQRVGQVTLSLPPGYSEYRVRNVNIAPGTAFKNLALVYGNIETIAGNGAFVPPGTNAWLPEYEGTPATSVPLSDPRSVVGDLAGNIYVSEKDSHAVSVIDSNGLYRTAIGSTTLFGRRAPGTIILEFPTPGDLVAMRNPTGLYYSQSGSQERIYVMDSGNGRILRYTNGLVTLLFTETNAFGETVAITNGGGLWVSPDELEAYYTDGKILKRWEADDGVSIISANFVDLSDVTVNPELDTVVVDRGDHSVWRVNNDGVKQLEAGTRFPTGRHIGRATSVSLAGPSSIVYLPIGGYLLGLFEGTSVWQIDAGDNAATLVFGAPGAHDGDGEWFQQGRRRPKISNVQDVTLAPSNDILMVEGGFVRSINFLRHKP